MCVACHNHCCASDEADRCGCDGCFEPDCWSEDAESVDFGDDMPGDDEDDGGVLMPLADCGSAGRGRFASEAVQR